MTVNATPIASSSQAGPAGTIIDRLPALGVYTITVEVGGQTRTEKGRIVRTQGWSIGPTTQTIRGGGR